MFDRFRRSWVLVKQSWGILRVEKGLVLFPILSAAASLAVLASFAVPIVTSIDWETLSREDQKVEDQLQPWHYAAMFGFYLVSFFITTFFNTGLIACANERLEGRDTNVSFGLRAATRRMPQILGWTLLNATVGVLLNMLAERLGWLGQLMIRLVGMAWAIATFFVVPVLAVEGVGPVEAVKRSVGVLRKTWGEAAITTLGFSAVTTPLVLLLMLLTLVPGGVLSIMSESVLPIIVGGGVFALGAIVVAVVMSTLGVIVQAALYKYAVTGAVSGGFDETQFRGAFSPKK
ncbi:MAG: hypothetical protein RL689_169 [Planctomycetota bacterium]|jgi:hypothetical protein